MTILMANMRSDSDYNLLSACNVQLTDNHPISLAEKTLPVDDRMRGQGQQGPS